MKADTIIRTICLAIALINQILQSTGHQILPLEDETVAQLVTALFTIITSVWAWWKNNSFTWAAIKADEHMKALKDIQKDAEK